MSLGYRRKRHHTPEKISQPHQMTLSTQEQIWHVHLSIETQHVFTAMPQDHLYPVPPSLRVSTRMQCMAHHGQVVSPATSDQQGCGDVQCGLSTRRRWPTAAGYEAPYTLQNFRSAQSPGSWLYHSTWQAQCKQSHYEVSCQHHVAAWPLNDLLLEIGHNLSVIAAIAALRAGCPKSRGTD